MRSFFQNVTENPAGLNDSWIGYFVIDAETIPAHGDQPITTENRKMLRYICLGQFQRPDYYFNNQLFLP